MSLVRESLSPARKPHKFTYRELLEMSRAGILGDARVELIDGELIEMVELDLGVAARAPRPAGALA